MRATSRSRSVAPAVDGRDAAARRRRADAAARAPRRGPPAPAGHARPVAARWASVVQVGLRRCGAAASQTGRATPCSRPACVPDGVHQPVDPRDAVRVGAGHPGQPQHRALDRHRGVGAGQPDDRPARGPGERPGPADGGLVEIQPVEVGRALRAHSTWLLTDVCLSETGAERRISRPRRRGRRSCAIVPYAEDSSVRRRVEGRRRVTTRSCLAASGTRPAPGMAGLRPICPTGRDTRRTRRRRRRADARTAAGRGHRGRLAARGRGRRSRGGGRAGRGALPPVRCGGPAAAVATTPVRHPAMPDRLAGRRPRLFAMRTVPGYAGPDPRRDPGPGVERRHRPAVQRADSCGLAAASGATGTGTGPSRRPSTRAGTGWSTTP